MTYSDLKNGKLGKQPNDGLHVTKWLTDKMPAALDVHMLLVISLISK